MNEAGREFNLIARSLDKQAHPITAAEDPIQPWVPIGGGPEAAPDFKSQAQASAWLQTASPQEIQAMIAARGAK